MSSTDPVRVDHGTARRFELAPGERIRIATPDGGQGGDFSFIGFDQAVTRNAIGWQLYGFGGALYGVILLVLLLAVTDAVRIEQDQATKLRPQSPQGGPFSG